MGRDDAKRLPAEEEEERKVQVAQMVTEIKAAIHANFTALLDIVEPRKHKQVDFLAARTGLDRTHVQRIMRSGMNDLAHIVQVADALGASPAALIDPTLQDKQAIMAKRVVDGVTYPCRAWITRAPAICTNADMLVARALDGEWYIGRYGAGPRTPAHEVFYYEGCGEPCSRENCHLAIFADNDPEVGDEIGALFRARGFSTVVTSRRDALISAVRESTPDILIASTGHALAVSNAVNDEVGALVPSIILCANGAPLPACDPVRGHYYVHSKEEDIVLQLRSMVFFTQCN